MTPMEPTNQSAVISHCMPVGGGVRSSVTWISTDVLAWTSGTQMTTSTVAIATRTTSEARRRVVPPPWGPRSMERTLWLHDVRTTPPGTDVSSVTVDVAEPMTFMSEGPAVVL